LALLDDGVAPGASPRLKTIVCLLPPQLTIYRWYANVGILTVAVLLLFSSAGGTTMASALIVKQDSIWHVLANLLKTGVAFCLLSAITVPAMYFLFFAER
jgi:hypothetical protein